jgi:putative aminopeptidase FrvX
VKYITPEGFIRFVPIGGWWDQVILGQRVQVLTSKGPVLGVTGAKPPHLLSAEERKKMIEKKDMYIDVGATTAAELTDQLGVRVGDPIVPVAPFTVMANPKQYLAKAHDNRFGCILMVEALRRLAKEGHPNTIVGAATVQEEVGLRGAVTSANLIEPDVAIVFDVEIAGDVPGIKPEETPTKMGAGPVLSMYDVGAIPNVRLRDLVIDTAKENEIPLQFVAVEGGRTDQSEIQLHGPGVPSISIGVAVRHIHSHTSILNRDDYDNTLNLVVALLKKLDRATVADFMQ